MPSAPRRLREREASVGEARVNQDTGRIRQTLELDRESDAVTTR
jgi:hypothetical protein